LVIGGNRPFLFTNLLPDERLDSVVEWVEQHMVQRLTQLSNP
jgi:hypothetical protein